MGGKKGECCGEWGKSTNRISRHVFALGERFPTPARIFRARDFQDRSTCFPSFTASSLSLSLNGQWSELISKDTKIGKDEGLACSLFTLRWTATDATSLPSQSSAVNVSRDYAPPRVAASLSKVTWYTRDVGLTSLARSIVCSPS